MRGRGIGGGAAEMQCLRRFPIEQVGLGKSPLQQIAELPHGRTSVQLRWKGATLRAPVCSVRSAFVRSMGMKLVRLSCA